MRSTTGFSAIALALAVAPCWLSQSTLLERLSQPRWVERTKAMRDARNQQSPEVLAKLIDLAANEPHSGARQVAIESLGYFDEKRIAAILLTIFESDHEDVRIRGSALEAMARRRDPGTGERLIDAIAAGGILQRAAIEGLVLMPTSNAFESLAKLHAKGPDPIYSADIMRGMLLADRNRTLDVLFGDLHDSSCPIRPTIARVLREYPGDDVRERCMAALGEDDLELQYEAVRVLGKCGDVRTIAKLTWLMNEAETLRVICAHSLGELGGPRVVRSLIPYLEDSSPQVRIQVAESLAKLGAAKAGEPLIRRLRVETDTRVLMSLVAAVGYVGEERAIRTLVSLLDDERIHLQPMDISRIFGFPYNIPLRYVALWSTRTILDGKQPFDLTNKQMLVGKPLFDEAAFDAARKWWRKHADDPRYSLGR